MIKGCYKSLIFLVLIASCKRPENPIGPEYKIPSEKFAVLNNSYFKAFHPIVDFSIGETESFKAEFNEKVSWKLSLTGLKSGATKTFKGLSNILDASNNLWNGNHQDSYFFRSGEQVVAKLTFFGSDLLYTDTVTISHSKNWDIPNQLISVLDFEKAALSFQFTFNDGPNLTNTKAVSDMQFLANNRIEKALRDINGDTIKGEPLGGLQGEMLYRMAGQDGIFTGASSSDYYIGGAGFSKTTAYPLSSNANDVYFNIYVYGSGDPTSRFIINFNEDDNKNGIIEAGNASENYVPFEDQYTWVFLVDWKGWKLMSVRYSDLLPSADGLKAKYKNGIKNPDEIMSMTFVLLSAEKGGKASVIFDFATFTIGKPFNPNE